MRARTLAFLLLLVLTLTWAPTVRAVGAQASAGPADYKLGPGDVIEVVVFGEAELSRKYTVRPDGGFEFPLVGAVKAAGMTARDVEQHLHDKLAEGFLNNPQVTVKVLEFNSQQVYVIGEVTTAGPVPMTRRLTVLEALSRAGGVTKNAASYVAVLRLDTPGVEGAPVMPGQSGVREIGIVSLEDRGAGPSTDNITLTSGDTVFVPKAGVVVVTGEVITPGAVPHTRNLTVLEAISLAGGTTKSGSDRRARIIRIVDGQKQEIKAKLTDVLVPGDIVRVPSRLF